MKQRLPALVVAVACLVRASQALAHGEVMDVGSTAPGSGALVLANFDFTEEVVVTPSTVTPTEVLYTSQFPSFQFITESQPGVPLHPLPAGVRLTLEIACAGSVCIDAGASVRHDRIADATGETVTIGEVDAGGHIHVEWRLLLPSGVFGHYHLPFKITTTSPGYSQSQVYTMTLTNIAPPTATATPTPTGAGATDTPSASPTHTSTPTATVPPALNCPAAPDDRPCRTAPRSALRLKAHDNPARRLAAWTWKKGETDAADYGDPSAATGYVWCLYAESAGNATRVMAVSIPAASACAGKPCWGATRAGGWKYKDGDRVRGGAGSLLLKPGSQSKAAVVLRAGGAHLSLPALPLAQDQVVRARLLNGDGECWEATYPQTAAKSDGARFSDKQ